jgi:signal transduction histidine kinase
MDGQAGAGLALFITRQLMQQHRGQIRVESQQGVGTCFLVEL